MGEPLIPVMDDPLSKHWEQPRDIRDAPMDDTHVLLTPRQLADLHEYSATIPTGVYPGKCWKRIEPNRNRSKDTKLTTYLMWYAEAADPKMCSINHRLVEVVPCNVIPRRLPAVIAIIEAGLTAPVSDKETI